MDHTSPYQAPASPPPPLPALSAAEPPAVKVFGILHLILAGLGVLFAIFSVAARNVNGIFINAKTPGHDAQLRYVDELHWVSVMGGVFMFALACLLLVAGLKLVRGRPDGVTWSHRYAWSSIATKIVSLVVTVVFVLPATQRMMGDIMETPAGMPAGTAETFTSIMKTVTSVITVASPLISCLYPILALYFLSRPRVKEWSVEPRAGQA